MILSVPFAQALLAHADPRVAASALCSGRPLRPREDLPCPQLFPGKHFWLEEGQVQ